jgi:hypothetical protein
MTRPASETDEMRLKLCQHCSGAPYHDRDPEGYFIACNVCGARGPIVLGGKDAAATAWNTRTPAQQAASGEDLVHREVISGLQELRDARAGNAIRYITSLISKLASSSVVGEREGVDAKVKLALARASAMRIAPCSGIESSKQAAKEFEDAINALLALPPEKAPAPGAVVAWREARPEEIAMALCLVDGRDPDAEAPLSGMCTDDSQPVPWWMVYVEYAEALLEKFIVTDRATPPSPSPAGERKISKAARELAAAGSVDDCEDEAAPSSSDAQSDELGLFDLGRAFSRGMKYGIANAERAGRPIERRSLPISRPNREAPHE